MRKCEKILSPKKCDTTYVVRTADPLLELERTLCLRSQWPSGYSAWFKVRLGYFSARVQVPPASAKLFCLFFLLSHIIRNSKSIFSKIALCMAFFRRGLHSTEYLLQFKREESGEKRPLKFAHRALDFISGKTGFIMGK